MDNKKIPLIAVVGATATGKTGLGISLAKVLDGEIISADSMQIYKGISVAAATPSMQERDGVLHHLMEFLEVGEEFSVADYVNLAKQKIFEVSSRGKRPILVGGTGLYVNSLVDNISFTEEPCDPALRSSLEERFEQIGGEAMLNLLAEFDSDSAKRLHPNNRRRIIRAFEVYESTGKTLTEQNILSREESSPFDTKMIGITYRDREKLYDRINRRVDLMVENGLIEEAQRFYDLDCKGAGQAIGHKELSAYFKGESSLSEAVEKLKRETRRYAKRQYTWFGRDERINWIYADEQEDLLSAALHILKGEEKREK